MSKIMLKNICLHFCKLNILAFVHLKMLIVHIFRTNLTLTLKWPQFDILEIWNVNK